MDKSLEPQLHEVIMYLARERYPVSSRTVIITTMKKAVKIPVLNEGCLSFNEEGEPLFGTFESVSLGEGDLPGIRASIWRLLGRWFHVQHWLQRGRGEFSTWREKYPMFKAITIELDWLDATGQPLMGYNEEHDILAINKKAVAAL